jgi:tetratricopeptide (TPR) repeat protein
VRAAIATLGLALLGAARPVAPPPDRIPAVKEWIGGDASAALAGLERLPTGRERDHNRAVALLYSGNAERAEALLLGLRTREPRWAPAARWLARAQLELGRPEAIDTASALLAMSGHDERDHVWAAELFARTGDLLRARDELRQAVAQQEGLVLAWSRLREVEAALGNPEAARAACQRLLALAGEPRPRLPAPVLEAGETLRYRVKYLCLRLATLTLETGGHVSERGRQAQRVALHVRSNPAIPFFHVDSRFESLITEDGSVLDHRNVSTDSDSGARSVAYEMEPEADRCNVRYILEGLFGYDALPLPAQPQDGISTLFLIRSLGRARASASVLTAVDNTWKPTRITTLGVERIRWAGREVEAVHVQSVGAYRGPGGLSGVVDAWVTDDARAVPLRARMKLATGSVVLELLPESRGGASQDE